MPSLKSIAVVVGILGRGGGVNLPPPHAQTLPIDTSCTIGLKRQMQCILVDGRSQESEILCQMTMISLAGIPFVLTPPRNTKMHCERKNEMRYRLFVLMAKYFNIKESLIDCLSTIKKFLNQ